MKPFGLGPASSTFAVNFLKGAVSSWHFRILLEKSEREGGQLPMNRFMGLWVGFEARFAYGLSRNLIEKPGAVRHAVPLRLARSSSRLCLLTEASIGCGKLSSRLSSTSAKKRRGIKFMVAIHPTLKKVGFLADGW